MVFVNLDRKDKVTAMAKKSKGYGPSYKCMNCREEFEPESGVLGRRFCSEKCRMAYMSPL